MSGKTNLAHILVGHRRLVWGHAYQTGLQIYRFEIDQTKKGSIDFFFSKIFLTKYFVYLLSFHTGSNIITFNDMIW